MTFTAAETVVLFAASRATAVMTCAPFVALLVIHEIEYGALVSSAAMATPSRRNVTPATSTLSDAFACSVKVPEIVEPSASPTIETVGGMVSASTVTEIVFEAELLPPAASTASTM